MMSSNTWRRIVGAIAASFAFNTRDGTHFNVVLHFYNIKTN
jgi:hypothetical protein